MQLEVNGHPRSVDDGTTVGRLVDALVPGRQGLAVAVNRELVPRREWDARPLQAADCVELVTFVRGG